MSSSGTVGALDPADRCQRISTAPAAEGWTGTNATTWWDRCGRRARVLSVTWDIDGHGLLMFIERAETLALVRADSPSDRTPLARFGLADVGPFTGLGTSVAVEGLMAGPRPGELLIAFHAHFGNGDHGPLMIYSTFDNIVVPVGAPPGGGALFAGFSVPSIDI